MTSPASRRTPLRIVFAGTPGFAVPALKRLVLEGFAPLAVLTQPDRPAGRGRKLQASPVKQAAIEAGISVFQPGSLKDSESAQYLSSLQPDLMLVVAYGLLLPAEVLCTPTYGCWNIHPSLLPRWRGAAPIQRAIEAGDTSTGVCIMQMDQGLDTGPVLCRHATEIKPDETGGSLDARLAILGAETLLSCVQGLADGAKLNAVAQATAGITYASKLTKDEAQINWELPALVLERKIRAFNPWPVAWCDFAGERTRIWQARALPERSVQKPGTIIATSVQGIDVAAQGSVLRLLQVQRPGGRQLSAAEFVRARSLTIGSVILA